MKIVIVCKWDSECRNISGESVDVDEFLSAVTSMTPNALQKNKRLVTVALQHWVMTHCSRLLQRESIL